MTKMSNRRFGYTVRYKFFTEERVLSRIEIGFEDSKEAGEAMRECLYSTTDPDSGTDLVEAFVAEYHLDKDIILEFP